MVTDKKTVIVIQILIHESLTYLDHSDQQFTQQIDQAQFGQALLKGWKIVYYLLRSKLGEFKIVLEISKLRISGPH